MARKNTSEAKDKQDTALLVDTKIVEQSVQDAAETGKKVMDEFVKITGELQNLGVDLATVAGNTGLSQNQNIIDTLRKTAEEILTVTSGTSSKGIAITGKEVKDLNRSLEQIAGSATALMGASTELFQSSANLGMNLFVNMLQIFKEMEKLLGGMVAISGNTIASLGEFTEAVGKLGKTAGLTVQALGESLQQ